MASLSYRGKLHELLDYRPKIFDRFERAEDDAALRNQLSTLGDTVALLLNESELGSQHKISSEIGRLFAALDDEGREQFAATIEAFAESDAALSELVFRLSAADGGFVSLADINEWLGGPDRHHDRLGTAIRARLAQLCTADLVELRRVDWTAPAQFLETLAAYERVHPLTSLDDLRDRLDDDRRCFALFHPSTGDRPVAIVWIALLERTPKSITAILNPDRQTISPAQATTAAFYSISNTHPGLTGLGLGNELLLQSIERLQGEFPGIDTFVTLSPVPKLRALLDRRLEAEPELAQRWGFPRPAHEVRRLIADKVWMDSDEADDFKSAMLRAAAQVLSVPGADPVANFHLSNGARLEAIHWKADTSQRGVAESSTIMVNYRYESAKLSARQRIYRGEHRAPISSAVRALRGD